MGLNIGSALGTGATIAVTIRAIDAYSHEFNRAKTTAQQFGTIAKGMAVGTALALAGMTVSVLKFAASVKTTDPEVLKLQKSLGTLKTMGDNIQLSFAKGMAPAFNQFAESAKKGQSGLDTLAKAAGSLVGGFFTGLDAIGKVVGKVGELLGMKQEQTDVTDTEISQNETIAQQYDQYSKMMELINGMDTSSIEKTKEKERLLTFVNTKFAASLPLLKQQYDIDKNITAETQKQVELENQKFNTIAAALKLQGGKGGEYKAKGAAGTYYKMAAGETRQIAPGLSVTQTKQAGGIIEKDGPIYAHKGEFITPTAQTNNMGGVTINVSGAGDPDAVARAIYKKLQVMGGA